MAQSPRLCSSFPNHFSFFSSLRFSGSMGFSGTHRWSHHSTGHLSKSLPEQHLDPWSEDAISVPGADATRTTWRLEQWCCGAVWVGRYGWFTCSEVRIDIAFSSVPRKYRTWSSQQTSSQWSSWPICGRVWSSDCKSVRKCDSSQVERTFTSFVCAICDWYIYVSDRSLLSKYEPSFFHHWLYKSSQIIWSDGLVSGNCYFCFSCSLILLRLIYDLLTTFEKHLPSIITIVAWCFCGYHDARCYGFSCCISVTEVHRQRVNGLGLKFSCSFTKRGWRRYMVSDSDASRRGRKRYQEYFIWDCGTMGCPLGMILSHCNYFKRALHIMHW